MDQTGRRSHWQNVYATKHESQVSWFQQDPDISLALIHATGFGKEAAIIDIGGGASRLADALLDEGYRDITVLDLSEAALAKTRSRLGPRAEDIRWLVDDATRWQPSRHYDVWHDRAALHFLTDADDRAAYAARLERALAPGGQVIIGTFAPDGPERCSGLPVQRHDAASLGAILGPSFALLESRPHDHRTPAGSVQRFQFSRFQRIA